MDRSSATRPTLDQWIRRHLAARASSRHALLGGIGGLSGLSGTTGGIRGRATHIDFRVYLGLDLQAPSQLAFPSAVTSAVYSTPLYAAKGHNPTTPSSDGIFSDGVSARCPS